MYIREAMSQLWAYCPNTYAVRRRHRRGSSCLKWALWWPQRPCVLCSRCRRRCRRTVATARVYSLGYSIVSRISCVSRHVDVKCNYRSGICPVCSNVSLLCCSVSIAMQGLLKCSWTERKLQSCLKLRNSQNSVCHTLNNMYEKKM